MKRNLLLWMFVLVASLGFGVLPTAAQGDCGPTVTVQPGDNLFRIAQRCGITTDELRAANPQVTDPTRLFVGTVLTIPQSGQVVSPGVVAIFPAAGPPGAVVTVIANGLPANSPVTVGFGPLGGAPVITSGATSGPYGELQAQTNLPPGATPGGAPWVVTLNVGTQVAATSLPFTITNPPAPGATATPSGTLFDRANIYLVALGDNGASGEMIGCMDSIIPVEVAFTPTVAPMTAAYQYLLGLDSLNYGESGLTNSLAPSTLTLQSINIVNRQALVYLSGTVVAGGVCDMPRIQAQLERVALQFATVDTVQIFVNGQPLASALG